MCPSSTHRPRTASEDFTSGEALGISTIVFFLHERHARNKLGRMALEMRIFFSERPSIADPTKGASVDEMVEGLVV